MDKVHKERLIIALVSLQLVFLLIFVFAFINYAKGRGVLGTGINYIVEDVIIMGFALISMINVVYELFKVK